MKKHRESRRPDSGTITIISIFMLTTLMAMAGLAVDLGFLYTRSRMMYAVADSAVAIGMKDLVGGASSSISTDINNIAGQYGGAYSISSSSTGNQVQVTVTHAYPLFFAKMLGFPSKTLTVVAIGKKNPAGPALLALGSGCGGEGISFNGSGGMTVNGDVESMGKMTFFTGTPGGVNINGNAQAQCAPTKNAWDTVSGSFGTGGPFSDPYSPYVVPTPCDFGSTSSAYSIPGSGYPWDTTTTPPTLAPGIYCSNGNLNLSGPGTGFIANQVTLISIGGAITMGATDASSITPNPRSPNGIVAYSTAAGSSAIFVGGPSGQPMTIGGPLYAPLGEVSVQSNGPMTTGPLVGNSLFVGDYASWTIGTGGPGGGSAWQMLQ